MNRQPNVRNKQKAQVNKEAIPNMDNGSIGKGKGAPVHTTKSRLRTLALGVCLLVTLVLGGIAARADEPAGQNTLTVFRSGGEKVPFSAAIKADYDAAPVEVDIYQIATAKPNDKYDIFDYTSVSDELDLDAAEFKDETGATDWEKVAQAAKKLVEEGKIQKTTSGTIAANTQSVNIAGLDNGLFLALPKNIKGAGFEYTFSPSLTALPTKEAKNGVIMTSYDYGDWLTEVTINLKPAYMPIYGALEITKTITEADPEDATFTFHITGKTPQGEDYETYAGITILAGKLTGSVIVDHIPAGTAVTVTEVYAAGRYDRASVNWDDNTNVIVADNDDGTHNLIHFSCTNTRNGDSYGGHGVQNNFRYKDVGGDWTWTPTPEDKATNYDSASK